MWGIVRLGAGSVRREEGGTEGLEGAFKLVYAKKLAKADECGVECGFVCIWLVQVRPPQLQPHGGVHSEVSQ